MTKTSTCARPLFVNVSMPSARILSNPKSARGVYKRNLGPLSLPLILGALKVRLRLEPIDD